MTLWDDQGGPLFEDNCMLIDKRKARNCLVCNAKIKGKVKTKNPVENPTMFGLSRSMRQILSIFRKSELPSTTLSFHYQNNWRQC